MATNWGAVGVDARPMNLSGVVLTVPSDVTVVVALLSLIQYAYVYVR